MPNLPADCSLLSAAPEESVGWERTSSSTIGARCGGAWRLAADLVGCKAWGPGLAGQGPLFFSLSLAAKLLELL